MKEDPHGSLISLFVSNLPLNLSQRQYRMILLDIIGQGNQNTLKAFDLGEPSLSLKENQGICFPSANNFSAFVIPWKQSLFG